jgi:hypothetical protein
MADINCPDGCEEALPIQEFDDCAPELNLSQIEELYYGKGNAAAFADVASPVEWAARLDQAAAGDKIRKLIGIGGKAKPTAVVKEFSKRRKKVTNRNHSLSFKVDETNQANDDAVRALQCGQILTIWYKAGGQMYGGNNGIRKVFVDAGAVLGEGNDDTLIYDYLFEWSSLIAEERCVSPI